MPVEPDEIKDTFRPGTGTHLCPECGATCEVQHDIIEFGEWIYCDECRIRFEREREPVVVTEYADDARTVVETPKEDKPEYVEYKCYECDTEAIEPDYRIHEKTEPVGEFEPVETGIHGYDECTLRCPCGERHDGYLDLGETINCDCGRTLSLSVEE